MFRNPLVSPDILGVSSGASLGAAFAILFGASNWLIQLSAFAGGTAAVAAVPQGIVVVRYGAADQGCSRPGLRQRRSGCKRPRCKGHRKTLTKIPSFHGFIPRILPCGLYPAALFYSIILFAVGCNFYLRRQTGRFRMRAAIGLRHPASASCLERHLRLAGRCPNNSSLFPPLAAVVVVALCAYSAERIFIISQFWKICGACRGKAPPSANADRSAA